MSKNNALPQKNVPVAKSRQAAWSGDKSSALRKATKLRAKGDCNCDCNCSWK